MRPWGKWVGRNQGGVESSRADPPLTIHHSSGGGLGVTWEVEKVGPWWFRDVLRKKRIRWLKFPNARPPSSTSHLGTPCTQKTLWSILHFRTTFWWYINWRGDALFPYFPPKENIFKCSSWCQSDIVRYHFPLKNLTNLNWTNFISQSVQSGWKIPHFSPFLDALASLRLRSIVTEWLNFSDCQDNLRIH